MVISTKRNSQIQKCCLWSPCRGISYSSHLLSPQSQPPPTWSSGHLWRKAFRSSLAVHTPSSHFRALLENLPSWISPWLILMVRMISQTLPLYLLVQPHFFWLLHTPTPFPSPPITLLHTSLLHGAFCIPSILSPTHVFLPACTVFIFLPG